MMTTTEKNKQAQQIASEGKLLLHKAELLLQSVVARNTKLAEEVQQTKAEIAEKIIRK